MIGSEEPLVVAQATPRSVVAQTASSVAPDRMKRPTTS
jgi:hypothetical protein